ncbi:MAG: Transposase [Cenarchaeum symbiont of Oopsacas minuta]|nr:Transposase [Cenarchaeum symbiont of Oopsacas minuta]
MPKRSKNSDGYLNDKSKRKPQNANKNTRAVGSKSMFVGVDAHKKFLQIAMVDNKGKVILNVRVENRHADIRKLFQTSIPKNVKVVMESSSVWHGLFRYMTDRLDLDVVLSNPYQTKAIAASTKKTDKVDAQILADLLRGGYINKCYVPNKKTVEQRQLVRYRHKLVQARTSMIHGILLQKGIKIPGRTFSDKYVASLKAI